MEVQVPSKKSKLTLYIIIALFAGIILGFVLNRNYINEENKALENLDAKIGLLKTELRQATDSTIYKKTEQALKSANKERNEVLQIRERKVEPFSVLADVFLRLIKMIVAPLVFTTLVVG